MQYLPQNTCKTSFFQIIVFYRSKLAVNALLATKVQILQFLHGSKPLSLDGSFSIYAKSLIPDGGFVLVSISHT